MITVNGEESGYTQDMTVQMVLDSKNFIFPLIIVMVDGVFVPREEYKETEVPDGARVEAIHLMSGG